MTRRRRVAVALGALAVGAGAVAFALRREIIPESAPAARGRLTAERSGCFGCHGEEPGRQAAYHSPSMFGSTDVEELREWILDGSSPPKPGDKPRASALLMPGFRARLSPAEVEDVVAYLALHAPPEDDVAPAEALARAQGCFACHGELGQGGVRNPGALKGYVPGFFGDDFLALTAEGDPATIREWVRDGAPRAFRENPVANHFLERSSIHMPAYGTRVSAAEIDTLVQYCLELHKAGPLDAAAIESRRKP
jgi:mono/diheme cytochrome c family protein